MRGEQDDGGRDLGERRGLETGTAGCAGEAEVVAGARAVHELLGPLCP